MSEAYRLQLIETLRSAPLNDIPAKLRELAERLEKGSLQTEAMVLVFDDDLQEDLTVIGFGNADPLTAHWLLCLAQRTLEGCR